MTVDIPPLKKEASSGFHFYVPLQDIQVSWNNMQLTRLGLYLSFLQYQGICLGRTTIFLGDDSGDPWLTLTSSPNVW